MSASQTVPPNINPGRGTYRSHVSSAPCLNTQKPRVLSNRQICKRVPHICKPVPDMPTDHDRRWIVTQMQAVPAFVSPATPLFNDPHPHSPATHTQPGIQSGFAAKERNILEAARCGGGMEMQTSGMTERFNATAQHLTVFSSFLSRWLDWPSYCCCCRCRNHCHHCLCPSARAGVGESNEHHAQQSGISRLLASSRGMYRVRPVLLHKFKMCHLRV